MAIKGSIVSAICWVRPPSNLMMMMMIGNCRFPPAASSSSSSRKCRHMRIAAPPPRPPASYSSSEDHGNPLITIHDLVNSTHDYYVNPFPKDVTHLPKRLTTSDGPSSEDGTKVRVAYQGIAGSFSEAAALKAYPMCETVACDGFEAAFEAVQLCSVDMAVVPIENSIVGSIHRIYDLLIRHSLYIVGEIQLEVDQCLLGLPGVRKEEVKRVISHPLALQQCDRTLRMLGIVGVNANDTAAAAAHLIAENGPRDTGAVASARAAEIYGLDILAERFQDQRHSLTSFIVLAREPLIPKTNRRYKTTIVFALKEGPAALCKALGAFYLREITLWKIETRPHRDRPVRVVNNNDPTKGVTKYFNYLFYVDFDASTADPQAQCALQHLKEYTTSLRVLGCYPMDDTLEP